MSGHDQELPPDRFLLNQTQKNRTPAGRVEPDVAEWRRLDHHQLDLGHGDARRALHGLNRPD